MTDDRKVSPWEISPQNGWLKKRELKKKTLSPYYPYYWDYMRLHHCLYYGDSMLSCLYPCCTIMIYFGVSPYDCWLYPPVIWQIPSWENHRTAMEPGPPGPPAPPCRSLVAHPTAPAHPWHAHQSRGDPRRLSAVGGATWHRCGANFLKWNGLHGCKPPPWGSKTYPTLSRILVHSTFNLFWGEC